MQPLLPSTLASLSLLFAVTACEARPSSPGAPALPAAPAEETAPSLLSPSLTGTPLFPADNYWHWDISALPVHPNSDNLVKSVGAAVSLHPDFGTTYQGVPWGIPYITVRKDEPRVAVHYTAYGDESDPGPFPIPLSAPIEGGPASKGDRHVIAVDLDAGLLYELFSAYPKAAGNGLPARWEAASGAVFDLKKNDYHPKGWTSADAAGLPILPGLLRYEEVAVKKEVDHAIRMTVSRSRRHFLWPASHQAGSTADTNAPSMGLRFRLKAGFDISRFSPENQVILRAMKKHGLIVADNGGNWFFSGAPDARWNDAEIDKLKALKGSDFEAVLTVDAKGNPLLPPGMTTGGTGLVMKAGKEIANGRESGGITRPHLKGLMPGPGFGIDGKRVRI